MSRPHVICQACFDEQSASWMSQSFLYCPHFRAMARRRNGDAKWTLDRGVSPEKARRQLEGALVGVAAYCERKGLDLESELANSQRVFEKKARPKS